MLIISRNIINKEGNFICECGKEFTKSQSFYSHQGHCKIHLGPRYNELLHGDRIGDKRAWSRGKTKETDPRIKVMADRLKGKEGTFKGHHHSEEFKNKMAEIARHNAKNHVNGWKSGSSKNPNKYETYVEDILIAKNISYQREVVIPQSLLGKKGSYYQLDFIINDTIDLEIDGSSHNDQHDSERDYYVGKKYKIYRIKHEDSMENLKIELNKFIKTYLENSIK